MTSITITFIGTDPETWLDLYSISNKEACQLFRWNDIIHSDRPLDRWSLYLPNGIVAWLYKETAYEQPPSSLVGKKKPQVYFYISPAYNRVMGSGIGNGVFVCEGNYLG